MKRKLSLLLAILMVAVTIVPAVFTATAEGPGTDDICEILDKDGDHLAYYTSLEAAGSAVKSYETIKIIKDITYAAKEGYSIDLWRGGVGLNATHVTVDGGGHTYTFTDNDNGWDVALYLRSFTDSVLKDLNIVATSGVGLRIHHGTSNAKLENVSIKTTDNHAIIAMGNNGTLSVTMDKVRVETVYDALQLPYICNFVLNDCVILRTGSANNSYFINNSQNKATVTINSGFYYNNDTRGAKFAYLADSSSSLTVNGGTFVSAADNFVTGLGSQVKLNGGSYVAASGGPAMQTGAAVRLVEGSSGIRFRADLSKTLLDLANSEKDTGTNISYGIIILPTDLLEGLPAIGDTPGFTADALTKYGIEYQNIVATSAGTTDNTDGSKTISAALIDLQKENYDRAFAATAYIKYVKEGQEHYVYSAFVKSKNSRSIENVAAAALSDEEAGYTAAQKAILQSYLPVA